MQPSPGRTSGPARFSFGLSGGAGRAGGGASGRRAAWLLLLAMAALGAALGLRPAAGSGALEVLVHPGGRVIHRVPAAAGDTFQIRFLHSVERSEVVEYFRIQPDGSLLLEGTLYHSQGVGLPFDEPGEFTITPEGMLWQNLNRPMQVLRLRTAESTQHQLTIHEQTISLSDPPWAGNRLTVRFRAGRLE